MLLVKTTSMGFIQPKAGDYEPEIQPQPSVRPVAAPRKKNPAQRMNLQKNDKDSLMTESGFTKYW